VGSVVCLLTRAACSAAAKVLGYHCAAIIVQQQQPVADAAAGAIERDTSAMFVVCIASSGVFVEMSMPGSSGLSSW
jgi:hypothetical protein